MMQSAAYLHHNLHQPPTTRRLQPHTHVELFLVSRVSLWKDYAPNISVWKDKNWAHTSTELIDHEFFTDWARNHVKKAKRTLKNLRIKTSLLKLEYKISGWVRNHAKNKQAKEGKDAEIGITVYDYLVNQHGKVD